jgi:DNA-binding PucR family transcriptional regulator
MCSFGDWRRSESFVRMGDRPWLNCELTIAWGSSIPRPALARAVEAGRPVVSYGEDRTEKWLTSETSDLRELASQVLGTVLLYDAVHSGDLVPSVRVWLEHDRQTDRAARALHIHPNTLLYRIRRFEQISGRSLASTEALAEVWLAMRTTAAMPSGLAFRL